MSFPFIYLFFIVELFNTFLSVLRAAMAIVVVLWLCLSASLMGAMVMTDQFPKGTVFSALEFSKEHAIFIYLFLFPFRAYCAAVVACLGRRVSRRLVRISYIVPKTLTFSVIFCVC